MEDEKSLMREQCHHLLPMRRKLLQKAIEEDVLNDKTILAAFYGGSIGANEEDLFSDIDLRIVVEEKELARLIAEKRKRAEKYGRVLYFEEGNPAVSYTVAHYGDFIKVDTFYYAKETIVPSVWLKKIKIIKDWQGVLESVQNNSQALAYSPSKGEVELWQTKFLANLHEAYRRAMRGEYYYALKCLDSLRLSMAIAWYMDKGAQPNAYGDWAHYEGKRSRLTAEQQSLLASWDGKRDAVEIMAVSRRILPEFKKVHRSLCEKTGVEPNREMLEEIIQLIL